jgi:spermidine synthase
MTNRILLLACFLSGAASLFYEILWTRAFSLILGSTVQATALIFAAFLTGLALGAWLFGSLSARLKRPLRAYILLELGIAVAAVTTGLILHHQADMIGAALGDGTTKYALAFLLAVAMILPPTLLMGGTLPIVLTIAQRNDRRLSIVGRFYGWNIFGAALGTLVCGFLSIRLWGITQSYYIAMALNLTVAAMCVVLLRKPQPEAVTPVNDANTDPRAGVLILSLEVIWARFAGFFLGNRTYAFTLLMFTVLTLLAAGSWLSAKLYRSTAAKTSHEPYRLFSNLLVLSAIGK